MKILTFLAPVAVALILWMLPVPANLDPKAWHLFAIFVATILGVILKPLPMGAVGVIALSATTLLGVLDIGKEALAGFSHAIIWMIVFVFFIARAFIKTKLGNRIAYLFLSRLGYRSLGMGYGLVLTEMLIAPFVPSNAARSGGIMFPILKSINQVLGSSPEDGTERKIGSFLTQVSYQGNLITSAMFLTAMAANPMAQMFAAKQGVEITWLLWTKAAIVPALISFLVIPWLLYVLYPPEVKFLPEAVDMAKEKLHEMGPLSRSEWLMLGTFSLMLFLWIFGEAWHITATLTALIGLSTLLITNVLTWDDVLSEKEAWNTLIWLAVFIMMSSQLDKLGFVSWFSSLVSARLQGMEWHTAFLALSLIYFYSHYFFASNTAHVSAMYAAFLAIAIAVGTPPLLAALVLGFFSSLFSSMTHYGTAPASILFGTGYVSITAWWGYGFIISVVNLLIWFIVGGMWWKFIGIW